MTDILMQKDPHVLKIDARKVLAAHNALGMKAQVVAVYDTSGSTEWPGNEFYSSGLMAGLSRRVIGAALAVDDNGSVPVYSFTGKVQRRPSGKNPEEMTAANVANFIDRHFPLNTIGGGTHYAPFIRQVVEDAQPGDPMLVLVFTDGDNDDHAQAAEAIRWASRTAPVFFQFFGVQGKGGRTRFPFLEELDNLSGRLVDNAGFSLLKLTDVTDPELMNLIFHEFVGYPAKAKAAGLIPWQPRQATQQQTRPNASGLGRLFGGR